MLRSVGLDIVSVSRIERAVQQYGDRFLKRILGPTEQRLLADRRDRYQFVAGRFAAKEAVLKALGEILDMRPPLRELQVVAGKSGAPCLILPQSLQEKLGVSRLYVSITHERHYAAAVAIIAEEK